MVPSIGRIVAYTLTALDAEQTNKRREDAAKQNFGRMVNSGDQVHVGNSVAEGDVFPMMIVRVWSQEEGGAVNGQVSLDGTDTLWVTSTSEGEGPGKFQQPPRV